MPFDIHSHIHTWIQFLCYLNMFFFSYQLTTYLQILDYYLYTIFHNHKESKNPSSSSSKFISSQPQPFKQPFLFNQHFEPTSSYRLETPVLGRVFVSVEGTVRDRNMLPIESFLLYLSTSLPITMLHCLQLSHIISTPKYLKWSDMLIPITDLKTKPNKLYLDSWQNWIESNWKHET